MVVRMEFDVKLSVAFLFCIQYIYYYFAKHQPFKNGFQYTTCNGKENILSEKGFNNKKSQFSEIFDNSILYLETLNTQFFRYLIICFFSKMHNKRKRKPKADQVPHPPRLRICRVSVFMLSLPEICWRKLVQKLSSL